MQKLDEIKAFGQNCKHESYTAIYKNLVAQAQVDDGRFAQQISSLSQDEQFIFTMHRWSVMVLEMERDLRMMDPNTRYAPLSVFERIRLPIGCYIQSCKSGAYYLNLGVEAKTLQGCLYVAHAYTAAFIDEVIQEMTANPVQPAAPNYAKLIGRYSLRPTVAIKYYDKSACHMGTTLNGIAVREKPMQELKVTKLVWKQAHDAKPLLPWLFEPHHNIIRLIEYWDDAERNALFMVLEFANCGELLLFIDAYHSLVYQEKKIAILKIDQMKNQSIRQLHIKQYQSSVKLSKDGQNAYIEFVRYIFAQIVQAIYTLHCQGFAHLDISCENFVLHFGENGQFMVKLIDFGRATKMKLKQKKADSDDDEMYEHEYEKYDFSVRTYPGKCRYMSPESSLFLKDKNAAAYDASKQDLYALGVTLYCLLTCSLPYDSPFYLENSEKSDERGIAYLNGDRNYKIDLATLRDIHRPHVMLSPRDIDDRFGRLLTSNVRHTLYDNCLLDYVSHDSLDLLNKLLTPSANRLSLAQLIRHPFVCNPPNPTLLTKMLQHVADFKRHEYEQRYASIEDGTQQMHALYAQRLHIKASAIFQSHTEQQQFRMQHQQTMMQQLQRPPKPDLILPPHISPMIQESVIAGVATHKPKSCEPPTRDNDSGSSGNNNNKTQSLFPLYDFDPGTQSTHSSYAYGADPSVASSFVMSFASDMEYGASPSPPPEPAYQYSPSPDMQFSPNSSPVSSNGNAYSFYAANRDMSMQQQQEAEQNKENKENGNETEKKMNEDENNNHTDAVHSVLRMHFNKISALNTPSNSSIDRDKV